MCTPQSFGQGMNYGMQDAFNLSWKLAAVVRGDATPKLLNSFQEERWEAGHLLVNLTETVQGALDRVTKTPDVLREIIYNFQKSFMYSIETFPTMQSAMRTVLGLLCPAEHPLQAIIHLRGALGSWSPCSSACPGCSTAARSVSPASSASALVAGERTPNVELVALQDPGRQVPAALHSAALSHSQHIQVHHSAL